VERKVLLRHDLDIPGREALLAEVRIAPGGREGRHTHAGTALATVLEGTLVFEAAGQPPRTMQAGESIVITPGLVHEGINRGAAPVRLMATFIVEKGQPLTTPAP
jgi:quercetin dioxygenase-like cupin family protein